MTSYQLGGHLTNAWAGFPENYFAPYLIWLFLQRVCECKQTFLKDPRLTYNFVNCA